MELVVTYATNYSLSNFLPYQLSITSNAVSGRIAQEYRSASASACPNGASWRCWAIRAR
jgi:hypothetical protein